MEKRAGIPYSKSEILKAETAVASSPKGPSGYPLDKSLVELTRMQRANEQYLESTKPIKDSRHIQRILIHE